MAHTDFAPHNHARCIATALAAAEAACDAQGLHLTPVRRRVLEILLTGHRALGAYDILERLGAEGRPAQPPVAYRALDFLVRHGFAHRVEQLNAYVACTRPGECDTPAFMVCRTCRAVAETAAPDQAMAPQARAAGFAIEARVVEAVGLCPGCQAAT
ncbi:transcriptional repressor [Rhodobacteraceae bacterium CCMM004]|nr:transcriptional repressor [Rhodobacteraceae bacterium CCMM004]